MNEKEVAELKAELEQVDYEEFEDLKIKVETIIVRFNELLSWLSSKHHSDSSYLSILRIREEP